MGKRIMNVLAFLAVLGGSVALTIITGRGSVSTMVYNFAFLAVMAVIYLVGMLLGMFRVNLHLKVNKNFLTSNSNGVIIVSDRVIKHDKVNHTLE